ncbi:MAG TPA: A/G-specific adenine glycosylase [Membranihabitans sp.]|nr:A/G-specific adenine glycosylase [Membranihabitans sp.]
MNRKWSREELEQFGQYVMDWSIIHPRPMPWKYFSDPYAIWIAEIILQQTRVEQGKEYFVKFLDRFPNLESLARASLDDVMKLWEGLGYYSRARNMHFTARHVWNELGGRFPNNARDLSKLKGIGSYTSAAIASFAFGEKIGVVDGNVKRVVSRYFGITEDINQVATHRKIQDLVTAVVQIHPSADFNQAIMNFGAMACTPRNPICPECPARHSCRAYKSNLVDRIPHKNRPRSKQIRWINFGVYEQNGQIALVQNREANIWKNLYMFPVLGAYPDLTFSLKESKNYETFPYPLIDSLEWNLTHRKLMIQFYRVSSWPASWNLLHNIEFVDHGNLDNFAIPRPLRLFLNQKSRKLGINRKHD